MGKTVVFEDAKRAGTVIGRALPRLEDETLLRGKGRLPTISRFPQQLHMRVVRSAHAHGKISR
jgi:CO/xanthine dehydrogenase Mo-binding subunit